MSDVFGRVSAILIGVLLLCILPVTYMIQRQDTLAQMYILTETTYLVDSVRNTGILTKEMLRQYETGIGNIGNLYEIEMTHVTKLLSSDAGKYEYQKQYHSTREILDKLDIDGKYNFFMDDFFRIQLKEQKPSFADRIFGFLTKTESKQGRVVMYYGGTIKYEAG